MNREIQMDVVEKMFLVSSSSKFIISSLRLLVPKGSEKFKCYVTAGVSVIPAIIMAKSKNTISMFTDTIQISLEVILALFGIVFTGYALFQALIGKEMLIRMLQNVTLKRGQKISKLQESNELFAETMMLQFLCIICAFFLIIILKSIPEEWYLFENLRTNNILAGIGIFIYFYVIFCTIIETKSFIFNMVELFNFHAGTRVVELLQESEERN